MSNEYGPVKIGKSPKEFMDEYKQCTKCGFDEGGPHCICNK